MPPLRPIPFLPQNIGQQQQDAATDTLDVRIQEVLSRLQPPQQVEVPKPSIGQKILAGLADALMAKAQVLAGAAPTGAGASEGLREQQEAARQQNVKAGEESRRMRNEVVANVITGQQRREDEAAQEGAISARQKADDERQVQNQIRDFITKEYSDLIEKFGPKVNPNLNPNSATINDLMEEKRRLYSDPSVLGSNADPVAEAEMLLKLDKLYPNIEITTTLDEEGRPKRVMKIKDPEEQQAKRTGQMTENQALLWTIRTGQNFAAMTPEQRANEAAKFSQEQRKWVPLKQTESDRYETYLSILSELDELDAMRDASIPGKPFSTSIAESKFRAKAGNLADIILRPRTGATLPPEEFARSQVFLPELGKLGRNQTAAIDVMRDYYQKRLAGFEASHRIPKSQQDAMRRAYRMGFAGIPAIEPDPSEFERVMVP